MSTCSIIVPVHNRASLTRQCLNLLIATPSQMASTEIIVIDDASTDLTPALLRSWEIASLLSRSRRIADSPPPAMLGRPGPSATTLFSSTTTRSLMLAGWMLSSNTLGSFQPRP